MPKSLSRYYQLDTPTRYTQFGSTHYMLLTTHYMLHATCYMLQATHFMLHTIQINTLYTIHLTLSINTYNFFIQYPSPSDSLPNRHHQNIYIYNSLTINTKKYFTINSKPLTTNSTLAIAHTPISLYLTHTPPQPTQIKFLTQIKPLMQIKSPTNPDTQTKQPQAQSVSSA